MPDVLAEVRQGWIGNEVASFLEAIHAAVVETLHTPKDDKVLRLVEHPPAHFTIPASAGERYTHIEIAMFAGRTLATKRALYKAIVGRLAPFGVAAGDIKVILIEVPPENVGLRGGAAACDTDIGYEIAV
ncbi:MAG: tautomerase family protein [Bradyrhizobium sp.]